MALRAAADISRPRFRAVLIERLTARRVFGRASSGKVRSIAIISARSWVSAVSAGEAVTWENKADEIFTGAHARIVETLEHPNSISVGASIDRTSAALRAGVLEPAIDASVSAQAANSIEKMLCHQMAAIHFSAMRLLELSAQDRLQPGDVARYTNAAARMMDVYQTACLTLQKLKATSLPECDGGEPSFCRNQIRLNLLSPWCPLRDKARPAVRLVIKFLARRTICTDGPCREPECEQTAKAAFTERYRSCRGRSFPSVHHSGPRAIACSLPLARCSSCHPSQFRTDCRWARQ